MAGAGARALPVAILVTVASLTGAPAAFGAVTFPKSDGTAGQCLTGPVNTDLPPSPPASFVVDPPGTDPPILVMNCTTIDVPSGTNVPVAGSRALELRTTGSVTIAGSVTMAGAAPATTAAGNGGPGGFDGGTRLAAGTGVGVGPSGGLPGEAGTATGGGLGGDRGPDSGDPPPGRSGIDGSNAASPGGGGGGGGAGAGAFSAQSRPVPAAGAAALRGGSGGGAGGGSVGATNGGGGGGGGGALRIIAEGPISVPGGGMIFADGGGGGQTSAPGAPFGGGGGGGGGGLVELISPAVDIGGAISALSGIGALSGPGAGVGGNGGGGRVRFLGNDVAAPGSVFPDQEMIGEYSVSIDTATSGAGSGTITSQPPGINCPPDCSEPFDPDTSLTLTASPAAGSTILGWSGDCAGSGSTCNLVLDDADPDNLYAGNVAFGVAQSSNDQPPDQPVDPTPQDGKGRPDLAIRRAGGNLAGEDVYGTNGAGQSAGAKLGPRDKTSFEITLGNDGDAADGIVLRAPRETGGFKLKYALGGSAATKQITGAGLAADGVAPGEIRALTVKAKAGRGAKPGSRRKVLVTGRSPSDPSLADAVRMKLRVPKR